MNNDNLANVLSAIGNAELVSKQEIKTASNSSVVRRVLDVLQSQGYLDGYTLTEDGRGGLLTVKLTQKINKVGAIKPRFAVKAMGFTKFEKRFLPAQGLGVLVVSTPKGIMTHDEAKQQNLGGKLLAYCY